MCCAAIEWDSHEEPDGICPDCEAETYQGEAYDRCHYSSVVCDTCGWSPCDGSC